MARVRDLLRQTASATVSYEVTGIAVPSWVAVARVRIGQRNVGVALLDVCGTRPSAPVPVPFGGPAHRVSPTAGIPIDFTPDGNGMLLAPVSEPAGLFEGRLFDLSSGQRGTSYVVTHTPTTSAFLTEITMDPAARRISYSAVLGSDRAQIFSRDITDPSTPGPVTALTFTDDVNPFPGIAPTGDAVVYHTRMFNAIDLDPTASASSALRADRSPPTLCGPREFPPSDRRGPGGALTGGTSSFEPTVRVHSLERSTRSILRPRAPLSSEL